MGSFAAGLCGHTDPPAARPQAVERGPGAGADRIPSAERFSRVLRMRRQQTNTLARLLQKLVGLEAKLNQYEQGERFIAAVEAVGGPSLLDEAWAGENCGLLLRGTKREDVERGQVVVKPGSVTPHTDFEGTAYILSKDEGGRHNPFYANYRPQFYFRTTDVTGVITLPEGTEMVMPGDTTDMTVELIQPIAMEEGLRFAIREGGRTVGAGTVTKILK